MKIAIAYPPLESIKGVPLLSQNRQFQWFKNPTYVYPMVPAYAATNLHTRGHDVLWMDGIAEKWSYQSFINQLDRESPNLIMIETKTPVIKRHWSVIRDLKSQFPELITVLVGDHVSWNPQESFANCPVDYILTGGDYDVLINNLVNHLERAENLMGGIWWREHSGEIKNSGALDQSRLRLDDLPLVDRELTRWELYAYDNGNFKYTPGTYTYAGRDCWWGRCSFCVWEFTLYPKGTYRIHSVEWVLDEVGHLIENHGIREIFDDTGTLPGGQWLKNFCKGVVERGYQNHVRFGHNMRFGLLTEEHYQLMGKAGFRFILYGLESANQKTLDRLDKGYSIDVVEQELRWAKDNGMEPHLTVMIGYPWETAEDSQRTVNFCREMFAKGLVDTLQGTIVVPYPGTPLYEECKQNGWLRTEDWDRYDMRESVMINPISDEQARSYIRQLYRAFMSPQFVLRKAFAVRSIDDLRFFATGGKRVMGHLLDFARKQPSKSK